MKHLAIIVPAIGIYLYLANSLVFTQDDAYISYRYVANFLNGDGLVYNIGEQVEGFTNFGWVIYMILCGMLGLDYILISKLTGLLFGGGIIVLTYIISREVLDKNKKWMAALPLYLVAFNQSLAYWSPAGLETAAFAFFVMLSVYLFLSNSRWLFVGILFAILLRPDGVVVAGGLILCELFNNKKLPLYTMKASAIAAIFLLPLLVFKLMYYGSIFPNTFYAKTGFNISQLGNGLEYTWRFLSHYGFYGAGLVISLFYFPKLKGQAKTVLIFVILFTSYIILVGGDVLKVHRFHLPLIGLYAILAMTALFHMISMLPHKMKSSTLVIVSLPLLWLTYQLPKEFIREYHTNERALTHHMSFMAENMLKSDSRDFSAAISTIGMFGYKLLGHDIIDLLGLTDSTIARHADEPIEEMKSTWKEVKHNSSYVLKRAPDYIVFSTGIKPSAPAEQALFLYPSFVNSYRTVAWLYQPEDPRKSSSMGPVFKKMRPIDSVGTASLPYKYVKNYVDGLNNKSSRKYAQAINNYKIALSSTGGFLNPYVLFQKGNAHLLLKQHDSSWAIFNKVIEKDSLIYEAHRFLYLYEKTMGNEQKAAIHRDFLTKLVPWHVNKVDSAVNEYLNR